MNLGPYASFIVAAYAIAALVVAGLIAWVEIDNRQLRQRLAALKEEGVSRRSDTTATNPAENTA